MVVGPGDGRRLHHHTKAVRGTVPGVAHGDEVPYIFGTLPGKSRITPADAVTGEDRAVAALMTAYWTNFAKRGDPNGEGVPAWPRFTDGDRRVMYFKDTAQPGPVPSADALAVLDSYFAWRRTPEGAAWAQ